MSGQLIFSFATDPKIELYYLSHFSSITLTVIIKKQWKLFLIGFIKC